MRGIKVYTELFGWLTLAGVTMTTFLYFQNLFNPDQGKSRVNIHCTIGKLTIITVAGHLLSQPIAGWNHMWGIWTGLGLYFIIMASGIVLLYLPDVGVFRYHARSVHPALVVGLAVSVIHHVLIMYGVIG